MSSLIGDEFFFFGLRFKRGTLGFPRPSRLDYTDIELVSDLSRHFLISRRFMALPSSWTSESEPLDMLISELSSSLHALAVIA